MHTSAVIRFGGPGAGGRPARLREGARLGGPARAGEGWAVAGWSDETSETVTARGLAFHNLAARAAGTTLRSFFGGSDAGDRRVGAFLDAGVDVLEQRAAADAFDAMRSLRRFVIPTLA